MKTLLTHIALLASLSTAAAQEPQPQEAPAVDMVRLELLIAQLPEARAIELLPELREQATCKAAQEKIIAMIGKQDAELVDWPILTTKSGQRAVVENIHELRYASEFSPTCAGMFSPDRAPVPTPGAPPTTDTKPEGKQAAPEDKGTFLVPASFEKRDLGVTLEVEPTIRTDGTTVDMQISPQHVTLLGWQKLVIEMVPNKAATLEQPRIRLLKTTTNINTVSGQPFLLSFHKLQEPAGKVEVFILTATVVKVGAKEGTGAWSKPAGKR